jgi:hypothetical protein
MKKSKTPVTPEKFIGHLHTVTRHRYLVMKGCFRVGLYRQGLLHDLSKFSPTEFMVGARYFQGNRSPNNAEREDLGYSASWLHHKGRNRHHFEYWMDYNLHAKEGEQMVIPVRMPGRYVVEMLMDRIAASKVYRGSEYTDADPLRYYKTGKVDDDRENSKIELQLFVYNLLCHGIPEFSGLRFVNSIYSIRHMYSDPLPEVPEDPAKTADMKARLSAMLSDIVNLDLSWSRTEDTKICAYCAFKDICGR